MSQPKLSSENILPDWLTVAAIAVIVYALTVFIHEALGHGLTAWFLGMKPHGLTSISLELDWTNASLRQIRIVGAAGTIVNLLAGAAFYLLLKTRMRSAALYYFCWLSMIVMLHGGGYLLINFFFGDWLYVVRTLESGFVWQIVLLICGLIIYFGGGMFQAAKMIAPLLGAQPAERVARARRLMWIPYLMGSLTLACAALFHEPNANVLPVALAEGFGATSLLLFLPSVVEKPKRTAGGENLILSRNYKWVTAGAMILAIFVLLVSRGISF